jgi:predicted nucleotidyltransferase
MSHEARYPVNEILEMILRDSLLKSTADWYGFGSFFSGAEVFSDIDLLAICGTLDAAAQIRRESTIFCSLWPVHLLIMTREECSETHFIVSEECKPLLIAGTLIQLC